MYEFVVMRVLGFIGGVEFGDLNLVFVSDIERFIGCLEKVGVDEC